jgi:hypothetical protein
MKQKLIIVIIAAIVVLGTIYWFVQKNNQATAPTTEDQIVFPPDETGEVPGDPDEDPQTPTSDTIAVSTQLPGSSVTIDNAFLSKPGFITIHEATATGGAGKIIGTSGLLSVGPKQDLEISATLLPGAKYIAMLREDNGDKKFTDAADIAVKKNNITLMTLFSVSQ